MHDDGTVGFTDEPGEDQPTGAAAVIFWTLATFAIIKWGAPVGPFIAGLIGL